MKKFLVLYLIPPSVIDEWMKTPAETRKSEEEDVARHPEVGEQSLQAVQRPRCGPGQDCACHPGQHFGCAHALVMYAIVQGDSKEAVAKDFQDHPHLQIPESSIEVMELFPLPDQA